ncbi:2-hydroxyacyl-CoA dehydratase family protein [Chloroflexota bacterium]
MNFYEGDIIKLTEKIKRFDENPDPFKLKCRIKFYERQLEWRKEQLQAWKDGKVFADFGLSQRRLSPAMGMYTCARGEIINECQEPEKVLEKARALGLPVDSSCDSVYTAAAMFDSGDIPTEGIVACKQYACTPEVMQKMFMAHKGNLLYYCFDSPYEKTDANVTYLADQFAEAIEYAEKKFPGVVKYDEAKLIEIQERDDAGYEIRKEIFEMLKHKPCPINHNHMSLGGPPGGRDPELLALVRDEIGERIEKGIFPPAGEKLRIIWTIRDIQYFDAVEFLAEKEAQVIFQAGGGARYGIPMPDPVVLFGGRKLTPLEKEAADSMKFFYGRDADYAVDTIIWVAKELQADAIVNFLVVGCSATVGLKRLVEERAEKELGIPTLQLESKLWDTSYTDELTVRNQLSDFVEMCLSQKVPA